MNCRTIRALGAHSTDPAIAQAISDHLATCPACTDELGELPAAFVQPVAVAAPNYLTAKIMAKLPETPQIAAQQERRRTRRRWTWRLSFAIIALAFISIGVLGMIVDSSLPATIFGGAESTGGRAALALTLAGKPMIALWTAIAVPLVFFIGLGGFVATWAWQRLAQPLAPLVAIPVEGE